MFRITAIILVFLVLLGQKIWAQGYEIRPNDSISVGADLGHLKTLSIEQFNSGLDPVRIHWKKLSVKLPIQWDANVCDNKNCYSSLADTGTMSDVNSGEYGFLLLHVTPNVSFDTALIQYVIWDDKIPMHKDTLTYIIFISPKNTISNNTPTQLFSLFPNPASSYIRILNAERVQLFNYTGQIIFDFSNLSNDSYIPLKSVANGAYFVRMTNKIKQTEIKLIQIQN
jgi:hypothetical protein